MAFPSDKLKVALTHDVDRTHKSYQYLTHSLKALRRLNLSMAAYHLGSLPGYRKVYWNFNDILDIENHYGVKSTFFFLIESIPFNLFRPSSWQLSLGRYDINEDRIVSMIRHLDISGWEIGLHGSYNSYQSLPLLKKEKQTLESITGKPLSGIRQHYLNLSEITWQLQKEAGFKYDASWGFTREIGYKSDKFSPFAPFGDAFKVFPLPIMDSCYMNTHHRKESLQKLIEQTKIHNGILVINWHSNNYHEKEFPAWKDAYIEIIEYCITQNAVFDTLGNFYSQMPSQLEKSEK